MRIDQRQAVAATDVVGDHVLNECRFAGPGLTDYADMRPPILLFDPKYLPDVPIVGHRERSNGIMLCRFLLHVSIVARAIDSHEAGANCVETQEYPRAYSPCGCRGCVCVQRRSQIPRTVIQL